jgi:hypothetical protein
MQALADSIDRTVHALASRNLPAAATVVPIYRCPSYTGPQYSEAERYQSLSHKLAIGNYLALGGSTVGNLWGVDLKPDAVIVPGGDVIAAEITDGLSHTLLVAESREESFAVWADGFTAAVSALVFNAQRHPEYADDQSSLNFTPYFDYKPLVEYGPSSMHIDGAFHLFGDGSVRFIETVVPSAVYVAFTTREGGETLGDGI